MKRIIAIMLAIMLAVGFVASALSEAEPAREGGALPRVGDVVHGFEAVEIREDEFYASTIVRFVHQKTGGELYYFANDDVNRVFNLMFFTETIDNTGVPHVFEHAITAGSEKYPSTALFMNLVYRTYNTYLNAHTNSNCTCYPCASLSEAQLLKYADFYTAACFHPLILENETIFNTEAWRYRLDDAEAPLTIEGTVYSEMLGLWTQDTAAVFNARRAAFPGSMASNYSGGIPDDIPDLTWEEVKAYHDMYYHPSNCAAYLYGRFDDYAAFLRLLDGSFSEFEKREFVHDDPGYTPIDAPVTLHATFPVEQGSPTEHASQVYYGIVCPGLKSDPAQGYLMVTLTRLMGSGTSDLMQKLQDALPYGAFSVYMDMEGPEDCVFFVAENVDPEDAETFKGIVDEAVRNVVENGFPQDQVDSIMAALSITARLPREGGNPVESVVLNQAISYADSGNPWSQQSFQDVLFSMDDLNGQGRYASIAAKWLADSQTTALVVTSPEPGGRERETAALAERLADVKAGMSDEEIAAIVTTSNTPVDKGDASEYVAQLQAVNVQSLPEEIKTYDVTDETDAGGTRHIETVAELEGIGMTALLLDASGLSQEDIHWFNLYTDLVFWLDTEAHTSEELRRLTSRYLYGGGIYFMTAEAADGGCHPYLQMSWIALDEDLAQGYGLMREVLFDTKVDDTDEIMNEVAFMTSNYSSNYDYDPMNRMVIRSRASALPTYRYLEYATGLEYYTFLKDVERMLREEPEAVTAKLRGIQEYFNNRANAVSIYAGSPEGIALNRALVDDFMAGLDEREIVPAAYELPVPARREALVTDAGVQYNLLLADYDTLGLEGFDGTLRAIASIVGDQFLMPVLRDQYGVYTPRFRLDENAGIYIFAYSDPNIARTYDTLGQLPEFVAGLELDQDTLDGYILRAYAEYAKPSGELSGAQNALWSVFEGRDPCEKLEWMRQLKQLTPEAVRASAPIFQRLVDDGMRATVGGAAAIQADADEFDVILDPFGE